MTTPAREEGRTKPCHGGLLRGRSCETATWRRVCSECLQQPAMEVPAARCRILCQPFGHFSSGRSYYVAWMLGDVTVAVRQFPLVGESAHHLLVFASEDDVVRCESAVPVGVLQPASTAQCRMRMCSTSKSFCPEVNFNPASGAPGTSSCVTHFTSRAAGPKRPRSSSTSADEMLMSTDDVLSFLASQDDRLGFTASDSFAERTASSEGAASDSAPGSEPGSEPGSAPGSSGPGSAVELGALSVSGTLFAAGQTLKAGGSTMWTVVSDARLKEVRGDFPLGVDELMRLRPRVFRYNGLGGTVADGREYVGLVAQEVPEALAPYCCERAEVKLRASDAAPTEILMLDHSAFPLLCVNALREQELRLRAVELAVSSSRPQPVAAETAGGDGRHHDADPSGWTIDCEPSPPSCTDFIALFCAAADGDDDAPAAAERAPLVGAPRLPSPPSALKLPAGRAWAWASCAPSAHVVLPAIPVVLCALPPLVSGVRKYGSDGLSELVVAATRDIALIVAPLGLYCIDAFMFPGTDEIAAASLLAPVLLAFSGMAAALVVLGVVSSCSLLARGALTPRDVADVIMEGGYNGVFVPALVLLVARRRVGPWAALRIGCVASVSTVWLCTSLVWTWSGGRDLWTYLDVPLPVAVLSSAAWLGTAHAATPEIRTKAVAVLHRLVGRGIPHSA